MLKPIAKRSEWYPDWFICQTCGRGSAPDDPDAKHWFVSAHRYIKDLYIVRCPEHITEHAMRLSKGGRTTANRERMRYGTEVWAKLPHPRAGSDPLPPNFIGADGREYIRRKKLGLGPKET